MPLRDYTADIIGISRERARAFARELPFEEFPFLYRAGRWREPITGLSYKCVDATCGRCGATMKLDYCNHGKVGAPFGFWLHETKRSYASRDRLNCPECGQPVTAYHIGYGAEFCRSWSWLMEPVKLPYKQGRDALALMCWRIYRCFDKEAALQLRVQPYEAYVVEEDEIVCMKHWGRLFYNTYITDTWRTNKRFSDTIYQVYSGEIVGDLHEAMLGTTAENSKLDLYIQQAETPFPAAYLRLWQKHRNVETLLTSGAGRLLGRLIEEEKRERTTYQNQYNSNGVSLANCSWKEKHPNDILRMDRAELREAVRRDVKMNALSVMLLCRRYGVQLRLPEDWDALEQIHAEKWGRILRHGIRWDRAERYLQGQKQRYPKDKAPTASTLADYWDMAKDAGVDLNDHAARWPMHLNAAHDQLLMHKKFMESEALRVKFEQRAIALRRFRFEADGLLIRQPLREKDLIVEGKVLNHCVATYAKRHAEGKTTILFIRRAEEPEVPYFTLNIDEKRMEVIQNHGRGNCAATPEVKAFTSLFMDWARGGCHRDTTGAPILPRQKRGKVSA